MAIWISLAYLKMKDIISPKNSWTLSRIFLDNKKLISCLISCSWQQTCRKIYDRSVMTPRLTAWYGDEDTNYQLTGKTIVANQWLEPQKGLKERIEQQIHCTFNSVLLNLHRDNNDSASWHRDRESELGNNRSVIGSVSLG